jgi:hypothetical protein
MASDKLRALVDALDNAVAAQVRCPGDDDFQCLRAIEKARTALDTELDRLEGCELALNKIRALSSGCTRVSAGRVFEIASAALAAGKGGGA